ncbi:hypothetical protein RB614_38700 [Phytohabitans sp. ZYX-F-186]|uniref:Uncharacterized protein n=1 Tax=Phytohabitans maris TaxID=3071409 RepID=A0ABU0ZTR9_9ACTN|nr:hypothetical protein [Phytohabitans sp. ZYX-F-186]MDQ7910441.1 hypothetical protein [Phytohabitans sp. ZYX-F-186]
MSGLSAVVTPYVLAGRLVQMRRQGPRFACPRCQGMDADETVVTYCRRCGDRRGETALRVCTTCQFDFRGLLPAGQRVWRPRPAAATLPPAPEAPAPEPSAPPASTPAAADPPPAEWPSAPGPAAFPPPAPASHPGDDELPPRPPS